MKRTLIFLSTITLLAGVLVLPASSAPWTAGNGNPAAPAQDRGNSNTHPVFGSDWPPFPNTWPFNDRPMPGNTPADPGNTGDDADAGICIIGVDSPCNDPQWDRPDGTVDDGSGDGTTGDGSTGVTETRDVTPAPEPDGQGDNWISYPNPRDHILDYDTLESMGDMKVCTILLNQAGEPIDGDTVADTTIQVDTDINEHEPAYDDADPVTFTTPLDQVADLKGTAPDLPEGDGMLDAECAEYHNLPFDTYTYAPASITGANADNVEFVGLTEYWDDANRGNPFQDTLYQYGENDLSDGTVTLTPDEDSDHAEVIYVFRLR
jgi:hypothetical protein